MLSQILPLLPGKAKVCLCQSCIISQLGDFGGLPKVVNKILNSQKNQLFTSHNNRGLHQSRDRIPSGWPCKTTTLGCTCNWTETFSVIKQFQQLIISRNTRADSIVVSPSVKLAQIALYCTKKTFYP